jgi:two-component system, OmpR family, alkaline phosphatase synthesis response regulator PhoP
MSTVRGHQKAIRSTRHYGAKRPDASLLHLMMPDRNGIETLKALPADPSTCMIPVVMLTAKMNAADANGFRPEGVKAIIMKPFNALRLAGQISEPLEWQKH